MLPLFHGTLNVPPGRLDVPPGRKSVAGTTASQDDLVVALACMVGPPMLGKNCHSPDSDEDWGPEWPGTRRGEEGEKWCPMDPDSKGRFFNTKTEYDLAQVHTPSSNGSMPGLASSGGTPKDSDSGSISSSDEDDLQMSHPSKVMQQFVLCIAAEAAAKKESDARYVQALNAFKKQYAQECGAVAGTRKQKKQALKHVKKQFKKEFEEILRPVGKAPVTPCGMAPVTPDAQFQGLRKGFLIGDEPAQRPMDVSATRSNKHCVI